MRRGRIAANIAKLPEFIQKLSLAAIAEEALSELV
jgi:hypothetical protein